MGCYKAVYCWMGGGIGKFGWFIAVLSTGSI